MCNSTKLRMNNPGAGLPAIPFTTVTADDELISQLRDEGHTSFPVVKVDLGDGASWTWSGYRHSEITKLAELIC